jgi:putative membrane protein
MEKITRHTKNGLACLALAALFLLAPTGTVSAHDGQPPAPHDLWSAWNWDPFILAGLALGVWVHAAGRRELRRRSGLPGWRTAAFSAGLATLFLALVSPLDALGAALFSAHMLQHMLLIAVVPPLLVLGVTPGSVLLGLAPPLRRELGRRWHWMTRLEPAWQALAQPWVAWALNVLAVWVWHIPGLYQDALQNEGLHTLEHLAFLGTSLLFWWSIMRPGRGDPGVLLLFGMLLQCGLLGALITFAPTPWYALYTWTTGPWGLSPLEDQQLAGILMAAEQAIVFFVVVAFYFVRFLAEDDRRARIGEPGRFS